jgi:hypothetical protein
MPSPSITGITIGCRLEECPFGSVYDDDEDSTILRSGGGCGAEMFVVLLDLK